MRDATKDSPVDRGEVVIEGVCQVCGAQGTTIAVPGAPSPNAFCARCAIEYGESLGADDPE